MCQSTVILLMVSSPACSEQPRVVQCQHLASAQIFNSSHQLELLLYFNSIVVCQNDIYTLYKDTRFLIKGLFFIRRTNSLEE